MTALHKTFGQLVRAHRKKRGLTQAALAERIGKSERTIARIERGEASASFHLLEVLSTELQLSPAALVDATVEGDARPSSTLTGIMEIATALDEDQRKWLLTLIRTAIAKP